MPKPGHAEYMRRYRATIKPRRERSAHQEGVQEGIRMAAKLLRETIAWRITTGEDAARFVEKTLATEVR